MTDADILTVLRSDLGELYPSEQRLAYLTQAVNAAKEFIAREGIALTESVEDGQLVEMYAAYLVRKRASSGGDSVAGAMPRMLRWALNNRLFAQKAGGADGT